MQDFLAQYMPIDASAHGPHLDRMNAMVHWLMAILFVVWGLYFLYVLYRFSASRNPKASYTGVKSHISSWGEIGVAVVEAVLLLGFAIPAWSRWVTLPADTSSALEIRVVAEQFAWNIHYPGADGKFGATDVKLVSSSNPLGISPEDPAAKDDIATINQLHLEVDRPVIIHLTSKDVIHSFSLPVMRVKQDAIPGISFPIHFTPVKTTGEDTWEIACAQLCGLGHYRMRGSLVVHGKPEFDAWLVTNAPQPEPSVDVVPETVEPVPAGDSTEAAATTTVATETVHTDSEVH